MPSISKRHDQRLRQNRHPFCRQNLHSYFLILAALVVIFNILMSIRISHQHPSTLSNNHNNTSLDAPNTPTALTKKEPYTKENNPFFVLHVGPPKTGTTTLQCSLATYHLKDSYYYIGKASENICPNDTIKNRHFNPYRIVQFLNSNISPKIENEWKHFVTFLEEHQKQRNNLIFSAEEIQGLRLEDKAVSPLKSVLNKWNVKIVVTYRRYHELVISNYNQHHKSETRFGANFWSWPDEGGIRVPTFKQYFQKLRKGKRPFFKVGKYRIRRNQLLDPVGYLKHGFEKYFSDVSILSFHDGNIVTNFICQMLPGAHESCAIAQNDPALKERVDNPSRSLHFDMLAVAAYDKKIINVTLKRKDVRTAIQKQSEKLKLSLNDFPLICLSPEEEDILLNMSLSIERNILPDFYASPEGESQHRVSFGNALQKKKFCNVDTDEVLKDKVWQEFFESLG